MHFGAIIISTKGGGAFEAPPPLLTRRAYRHFTHLNVFFQVGKDLDLITHNKHDKHCWSYIPPNMLT